MNARTTFPPIGAAQLQEAERQLAFRRLVALFQRDEIEAAVDELIAHLDTLDGDLDLEPNGDELDGADAEDELGNYRTGAGYRQSLGRADGAQDA